MRKTIPNAAAAAAAAAAVFALVVACTKKPDATQRTDSTIASTSSTASTEAPISSTENAVAPEVNPPGDIPDTQAFVSYTNSPGGFRLEVPEGWARTENGPSVSFVNKFDGVKVDVGLSSSAAAPTAARSEERRVGKEG